MSHDHKMVDINRQNVNVELRQFMTNRQIEVQRRNFVQVCRFTVKTLIDHASLNTVDDDSLELINFCAALEQVLSFRLREAKTWYGSGEPRSFWHYIQQACKAVPNNCIHSISSLENVKSPVAKGRAWIRCVLMEKRLSEYLTTAIQNTKLTRQYYMDKSVMLSDDISMLCGVFLGLSAIDFSFCLKGMTLDFLTPAVIDFTPYLKFHQSAESVHSDLAELNGDNQTATRDKQAEKESALEDQYQELQKNCKLAKEQKGYLEELLRLRENQIQENQKQKDNLTKTLKQFEEDSKQERIQLESVVLELQQKLDVVQKQKAEIEGKYSNLMSRLQGNQVAMEDVAGRNMENDKDRVSRHERNQAVPSSAADIHVPHQSVQRLSVIQDDSQSMVAMAGSFSSQVSEQLVVPALEKAPHDDKHNQSKKIAIEDHLPVDQNTTANQAGKNVTEKDQEEEDSDETNKTDSDGFCEIKMENVSENSSQSSQDLISEYEMPDKENNNSFSNEPKVTLEGDKSEEPMVKGKEENPSSASDGQEPKINVKDHNTSSVSDVENPETIMEKDIKSSVSGVPNLQTSAEEDNKSSASDVPKPQTNDKDENVNEG